MTQRVGRNDPCPCGSGRKYKNCHGRNPSMLGAAGRPLWVTLLLIAAAGVAVALGIRFWPRKASAPERFAPQPAGAVSPTGPDPSPFTYDAKTNQHWDPTHRHWHDGPPPAGAGTGAATPTGPEPSPWTYDERTGQHWDPNHHHWHQGPPPPPEARVTTPGDTTRSRGPGTP